MKDALLTIKILTDATKASKGLNDAEKSVGKFHGGMQKAGVVAAAAGGAVLAFGVSAAQAAAEDARGQAILKTALENSTGARQKDIDSVESWISKTAAATGVADDQLRPALATLARATGDVATSQKAMSVALDVSAATGKGSELGFGGHGERVRRKHRLAREARPRDRQNRPRVQRYE